MSLGIGIKGPEGIVLACDSRITLTAEAKDKPPISVNFDNATKIISFSKPHNYVGAITYGAAVIGLRTAYSFVSELEVLLDQRERLPVLDYAELISDFLLKQWKKEMPLDYYGPSMVLIVGGYDPGAAYGKIYVIEIPKNPEPIERNPGEDNFGMSWGGQLNIVSRLIHGYDPILPQILQDELDIDQPKLDKLLKQLKENLEFSIPYQVLPLQDCVDLATVMIQTTMNAQNLSIGVRGVGGPIDIAVITKTKGLEYIQKKSVTINKDS